MRIPKILYNTIYGLGLDPCMYRFRS